MHFLRLKKFFIIFFLTLSLGLAAVSNTLAQENVSIDFDDVDIKVFVKFISEVTGKNFVVDNRVKGKITVLSPGKISPDEAYKVFESVLDVHGYAAVPSGDVIKIVSTFEARTKNMETVKGRSYPEADDTMITQIVPLEYADPRNIKRLISPIVSKRSAVMPYEESSMLLITDYRSNIYRILKIIEAVDIQETGREITIIDLDNADAEELAKTLKQIFPDTKKADEKITVNNVRFIPDERTNTLIAVAGKQDIERIKKLVDYLDRERPKGDEKFHVYYLENASAEKLVEVLQNITSEKSSSDKSKKAAPIVSGDVYITADVSTNSIIIKASKNDYEVIKSLITKLDINRPMVYLECLIIEMNTDRGEALGAEWAIGYDADIKGSNGGYGGGFSGGTGNSSFSNIAGISGQKVKDVAVLPSGMSVGVFAEALKIGDVVFPNLGAVINAYKNAKDVNILSTPQITTLDNEKAKIYVGKNIPYLVKSSTGDSQYSNFEYKDVGTTLEITPQISQDGLIKLKIYQEVSTLDVGAMTVETATQPTTLKRTIDTSVVVKNNHTVVLGGLIDDAFSSTEFKVPCLGDIPVVGFLFKSVGESHDKTNLFVFITPRVIDNNESAKVIYDEKRNHIKESMENTVKERVKDIPLYE